MSRKAYFPREQYTGDASTTAFTFDFLIRDKSELLVEVYDDEGELQFSVNGMDIDELSSVTFDETEGGGTVTFSSAPAQDYVIVILLNPDEPTQDFEFRNKSAFTLRNVEKAFDAVMGPIMRLSYLASRSIRIGNFMSNVYEFDPTLPSPEGNDGKILALNLDGDGMRYGPTVEEVEDWKDDAEAAAAAAAVSEGAAASSASASAASASAASSSASASAASASDSSDYADDAADSAAAAAASAADVEARVSDEMSADIENDVSVAASIADFIDTTYKAQMIFYRIMRKTDSDETKAAGVILAVKGTTAWAYTEIGATGEAGVMFSSGTGAMSYTSSLLSGSNYQGKIYWRTISLAGGTL